MRRIAIINQKGGVGKTTTTVNLSAALAAQGQRVQVIDLDPQAHATLHLGADIPREGPSVYNVLTGETRLRDIRAHVEENLWVTGAHIDLAAAEMELADVPGREIILRDQTHQESLDAKRGDVGAEQFDYILMDCPPSLGVLTLNALTTANEVIIPLQPHFLALHGLSKLLETVALVWRRINPRLHVTGVALCMVEQNTRLAAEVVDDLEKYLESGRERKVPWAHARIFNRRIRRNVRLAECPSYGESIFRYSPESNGAQDYQGLAEEVHALQEAVEAEELVVSAA